MTETKDLVLTVTPDEANVLGMGLHELPLKVSGVLFSKLVVQIQAQTQPAPEPVKATPVRK